MKDEGCLEIFLEAGCSRYPAVAAVDGQQNRPGIANGEAGVAIVKVDVVEMLGGTAGSGHPLGSSRQLQGNADNE